jgi:hypothetical protein
MFTGFASAGRSTTRERGPRQRVATETATQASRPTVTGETAALSMVVAFVGAEGELKAALPDHEVASTMPASRTRANRLISQA